MKCIPIYKYDAETGDIKGSYPSIAKAANEHNCDESTIRKSLNSFRTAAGHMWSTLHDTVMPDIDKVEFEQNIKLED